MTELDDLMEKSQKADAAGDNAPQWKPTEEGDQLAGTLTKIDLVATVNGDNYVVTITQEDGDARSLWLGTVLLDKFLTDAPALTSLIVVTYKGSQKSKGGYTYKLYDMQSEEEKKGDFKGWSAVQQRFMAKKQLLEEAATGGSGVAPDSSEGLAAPF